MKKRYILYFFMMLLSFSTSFAMPPSAKPVILAALQENSVVLNQGWKFYPGDNPAFSQPSFDDSNWEAIDPTQDVHYLPQLRMAEIGWLRLHIKADSSILNQSLSLLIRQSGASEIYLNGKLIHKLGVVSKDPDVERTYRPNSKPYSILFNDGNDYVLAVRYSYTNSNPYMHFFGMWGNPCFIAEIKNTDKAVTDQIANQAFLGFRLVGKGTFLLFLAILHLFFYISYPQQRTNLYYSLFLATISIAFTFEYLHTLPQEGDRYFILVLICSLGFLQYLLWGLAAVYSYAKEKRRYVFWFIVISTLLYLPLWKWLYDDSIYYFPVYLLLAPADALRVSVLAMRRKIQGAKVVFTGWLIFFICMSLFTLFGFDVLPRLPYDYAFTLDIAIVCVSLTFFVVLAQEYAQTNRSLQKQIVEMEALSAKSLAQEQEKQQILAAQNETLERQVAERTAEVVAQKESLQSTLEDLRGTQAQLVQKEKMASLGELTAGIAHEIQNPLNFVNNFSEVSAEMVDELEQEVIEGHKEEVLMLAADLKQNLQKIHHHGRRADSIVKNMLQHSRTSAGEKQWINLNVLAEEYLRLAYSGIRAKDRSFTCTLNTSYDQKMKQVEVVPQELGRVLLNLFNNAFYAMQQRQKLESEGYEPHLTISTQYEEGQVEIQVQDNGIGMPERVKNKIFQPFFTTKPTGEGTGLGLSLSYDIITKGLGGELKVQSEEGKGSVFTVALPNTPVPVIQAAVL